jgi:hypothetical protein
MTSRPQSDAGRALYLQSKNYVGRKVVVFWLIEFDFYKDRLKSSNFNKYHLRTCFQTLINHFHQLLIHTNSCTSNKREIFTLFVAGLINKLDSFLCSRTHFFCI